jgi:hypothetical protein
MEPIIFQQLQQQRQTLIDTSATWSLQLLAAIVAIGFLTMTLLEMFKVGQRYSFNKNMVKKWLENFNGNKTGIFDLIILSTAGDEKALFSLPIENLCGQISAAAQAALDMPTRYKDLIFCLVGQSVKKNEVDEDIKKMLEMASGKDSKESGKQKKSSKPDDLAHEYSAVRSRVASHIQRNIDGLQITVSYQWKNKMRKTAIVISFIIALLGSLFFNTNTNLLAIVFFSILAGYGGGFVSSIFREMMAALERAKK